MNLPPADDRAAHRNTVLVVSSVHPPDDPRIRQKLVETLRGHMRVVMAVAAPGPSNVSGIAVEPLRGSRLMRTLRASWKILRGRYDVVSVHDPELLPAAIGAGLLGRHVVFDVHEDVPAQIRHKEWVPGPLRGIAARVLAMLLRLAERFVAITLAEPGYGRRHRGDHPVFPNTLPAELPERVPLEERRGVVYLGDVTSQRGVDLAVEALGRIEPRPPLTLIGRCSAPFRAELESLARKHRVSVRFAGYLPHPEALRVMGRHRVGISPLRDIPNYRDSLPTKLLEYLAMGLPVVASDLPGARGLLGGEAGIAWVLPDDARAIASAIERIMGDIPLLQTTDAAADSIRVRYRWPEDDVAAFYAGLANGAAVRGSDR